VKRLALATAVLGALAIALGFFFGERMASKVRDQDWRVVPECTAVYWRRTVTPPGR